VIKEL